MSRKYDQQTMQLIAMFEQMTGSKLRDCFAIDDLQVFVVEKGQIGRAVGRAGANVKKLASALKSKIKIIEYSEDLSQFVKNTVHPIKPKRVEVDKENKIALIVPPDLLSRGLLIGRQAIKLRETEKIVQRFFDLTELKVGRPEDGPQTVEEAGSYPTSSTASTGQTIGDVAGVSADPSEQSLASSGSSEAAASEEGSPAASSEPEKAVTPQSTSPERSESSEAETSEAASSERSEESSESATPEASTSESEAEAPQAASVSSEPALEPTAEEEAAAATAQSIDEPSPAEEGVETAAAPNEPETVVEPDREAPEGTQVDEPARADDEALKAADVSEDELPEGAEVEGTVEDSEPEASKTERRTE